MVTIDFNKKNIKFEFIKEMLVNYNEKKWT